MLIEKVNIDNMTMYCIIFKFIHCVFIFIYFLIQNSTFYFYLFYFIDAKQRLYLYLFQSIYDVHR
jgi:hypothetical protein